MDRAVLTDAAGTAHEPAGAEARIVSLVPSITELIVDLGLADKLVGRTHYCIHPADVVEGIPSVGGTKKIKMDRLRVLAPTHVIVNVDENTREMVEEMRAFVPHIVVTHPLGPEDNPPLYRLIGGLFGREVETEALCTRFDEALDEVERVGAAMPEKDVVYFIWKDPWMTVSADTYIARMLALVNWRCTGQADDSRYPGVPVGPDLVAATDLFLFSSEPYTFKQADIDAFARETGCPASKCRLIDGEYTSWYGSRAIEGLRYLARFAAA